MDYFHLTFIGTIIAFCIYIEKSYLRIILSKVDVNYQSIFRIIVRAIYISVISMTIMSELGLDINALLTSFGVTGLAISLASREVLSNIISGIFVQIQKPYKIGDIIQVKGHSGKVLEISIRYTVLLSEQQKILVPNRLMLSEPIVIL